MDDLMRLPIVGSSIRKMSCGCVTFQRQAEDGELIFNIHACEKKEECPVVKRIFEEARKLAKPMLKITDCEDEVLH